MKSSVRGSKEQHKRKRKTVKKNRKQSANDSPTYLLCPQCREEMIDWKYLDYYGGICQKCGYDFYTGWSF